METTATQEAQPQLAAVEYQTDPSRYKHWRITYDPPVATLTMDVNEEGGLRPGYKLKLNSYDLGVDIELYDALQRIRFEHPEIRSVVITSGKSRIFCSGANIYMLGLSSHAWKVNFCKFTNETRNGIEDASAHSGLKFLAALNGTTAGGGYELALACDELVLVDDRSSAVSLPEVPLLGVLPGTGGLTRLTDKRRVRRDHADVFCTNPDGVKGQRAKDWKLVDETVKTAQFGDYVKQRAQRLAERSDRPANAKGVMLTPLERTIDDTGRHYKYVDAAFDRDARTVTITVRGPEAASTNGMTLESVTALGAKWWPLQMARELDDAILSLRTDERHLGLWILKATGDADAVLAMDKFLIENQDNWFVREVLGDDAEDVCAARRVVAIDVCAGRARYVLRRNAGGAGVRGGPRVHARHAGGRREELANAQSHEFRRAADGGTPIAPAGALSRRRSGVRRAARTRGKETQRGRSARGRPCDGGAGRSGLGGRNPAGDRIAHCAFAGRADGA